MLTVNIGAAAADRAQRLLEWLASRPEDVFLITETSSGPGTALLLDRFRAAGHAVVHTPAPGDRGAALISRIRVLDEPAAFEKVSIPGRVAAAVLDTQPRLTVAAVYVPSRDRSAAKTERKQQFITTFLDALRHLPPEQRRGLVVGGDYNVIGRDHRPAHAGFLPFEYAMLDTLSGLGLIDAHAACHPGDQPHSWIGRTGDGYRYDYFHLAQDLAQKLIGSGYVHEIREQGLTDHAAAGITVDVEAAPALLDTGALTISDEIALF
ncbi:endonuclease/exonuclease/phosphatase family protein [Actinomadura sp. SCN-SB]|uniref:endonuclease/exonuclease/phosphatase family protein n=1 Tax=Actinomadura sp. SCN-SB TaxID=3373092 RepID=UPI003750BDFA